MTVQTFPTDHAQLLGLTTQIAAAYLSRNPVGVDEVGKLIAEVHAALAGKPAEQAKTSAAPKPAVPVSRSVTPEHVICLECGKAHKSIKQHLMTSHRLSPERYRERWRLDPDYPMSSPSLSRQRSAIAKRIGLGRGGRP